MVVGFVGNVEGLGKTGNAPITNSPLFRVIVSILNLSASIGGNISKPKEELLPCTFTNHRLLPLFSDLTATEKGMPDFFPATVKHVPAPSLSNVSLITSASKGSRAATLSELLGSSSASLSIVVLVFKLRSRTRPSSFPTRQWGA